MSLSAAVIRELVAAGLSGDALVAACERIEDASPVLAAIDQQAERRREKDRLRKQQKKNVPRNSAESAEFQPEQKEVLEPKKNIITYPKALAEPLPQGAGKRVRGHRLPDDWKPGAELHAYAMAEGIPNHLLARIDADFVGYWRNATGPNSRKLDWGLAYQGWVRREADKVRAKSPDPPKRVWGSV